MKLSAYLLSFLLFVLDFSFCEAKQMIWLEGDTMYYPQGVTDPDYCVLKFTAEKGIRQ